MAKAEAPAAESGVEADAPKADTQSVAIAEEPQETVTPSEQTVAVAGVEEPVAKAMATSASAPVEEAAEPEAIKRLVSIEAVEIEGETLFIAGAAEPAGSTVRLYVDNQAISDTVSGETGRFLFDGSLSLDAGEHQARVDLLGADGEVASRAEVSFSKQAVPVASVKAEGAVDPSGAGKMSTAAMSDDVKLKKVIIRRGDNLWQIARRVYGAGIRYSTIYDNNNDQIRDPDLIYPGQVFELPQGEEGWETNFDAVESPPEGAPVGKDANRVSG